MKFFTKKNYIISLFLIMLFLGSKVFARDNQILYTSENISNYFLGIISADQNYNKEAFKHFKKVKTLKDKHSQFNSEFIKTLVLLEKFDQSFKFSKKIWDENEYFFEADLLLGLESFINKDYEKAEYYFQRLNKTSQDNFFLDDFVGNILIAWSKASQGNKVDSFKFLEKIPKSHQQFTKIQKSFLECYFDSNKTQTSFEELINDEDFVFSRYNYFIINYLLSNKKKIEAKKVLKTSRKKYSSNLLIKQTEIFFLNNKIKKINSFFDCENENDSLAEFFYILANLLSSEKNYKLSNFYLKISLFLNSKFLTNKTLLAENLYYLKKYKSSKDIYKSIKSLGQVYSWHASINIATILSNEKGKAYSVDNLEEQFNLLSNPNFEHFYDLANFYKDNDYYEKSVNYYSLALQEIKKDHRLIPKILDRRGTSFERLGNWENAEKDLLKSLELLPNQAHVLNYLAYSWVEKKINLDKALLMLMKAAKLKKNDGYIIDSLGWAYYAKKNYIEAELFLQKAVELMPSDPIVNDHYADTLWMLNKNIQARYLWSYVLNLDATEKKLKDTISKKLIFGITKQL